MSDTRTLHRSLRERLGGRWAVSILGYLILFPLSFVLFLLTDDSVQRGEVLNVMVIGVAGNLAAGAVLVVASLTVLRNRRAEPAPVLVVITVGALSGVARSAVIALLLEAWAVPTQTPLWSRLVLGLLLGAFTISAIAFLLDVWDQFSGERRRLLAALAQEELRASGDARYLTALREAIIVDSQQQVDSVLSSARRQIDAEELTPQETATLLRDTVDDEVRQTSHELWEAPPRPEDRLSLRNVLALLVATRPFAPEWVIAPLMLLGFVLLGRTLTPVLAVVVVALFGVLVSAIMLVSNAAIRRWPSQRMTVFWIAMAGLALSGGLLGIGLYSLTGDAGFALAWTAVGAVVGVVSAPLGGIGPALAQQAEQVLANLRRAISDTEIKAQAMETEANQLQRRVARYLHGTVRANLTAITMRLEDAIRSGDETAAGLAMSDARELLAVQIDRELGVQTKSLTVELSELSQRWLGLLDVRSGVDGDLMLTPGETRSVTDLVTEAVHDAARHANAQWITIDVQFADAAVVTRIENDGEQRGGGDPGLGSRSLDELAPGAWQRVRSGDQTTVLTVTMPRHP